MKFKLTAILVTTILATGVTAQPPAAPPVAAAVSPRIMADPALWVVKDADTTIYLFGTVHVLKPGTVWFDGGVKRAYDASKEVVIELIQPDPAAMQASIIKFGVDHDGPPLTQKLTPEVRALYEKVAGGFGIPVAALEKYQPWMVSTVLSLTAVTKAGYDPKSGVEVNLTEAVKRDGKTLTALETAEEQLGFFASLPEASQIAFLKATLEQLPEARTMFDGMVADWAKGDPEALGKLLNASLIETPELAKVLLTDRNARWAKWIDDRLDRPGTVFVAVGAGHLAGKNSVQEQLRARKLKAVRIAS